MGGSGGCAAGECGPELPRQLGNLSGGSSLSAIQQQSGKPALPAMRFPGAAAGAHTLGGACRVGRGSSGLCVWSGWGQRGRAGWERKARTRGSL